MNRKEFIQKSSLATIGVSMLNPGIASPKKTKVDHNGPLAITMWDFSWLERRWAGAGYEDWDLALDELKLRGYDAVRIDAYPHLIAKDPQKTWELTPVWNTQDWGSPTLNRVQVMPALIEFMKKCATRDIKIALSSWFRQDTGKTYLDIKTPKDLADIWIKTLQLLEAEDLLDNVLFVDLCNEFPLKPWTPFLPDDFPREIKLPKSNKEVYHWIETSISETRKVFPQLKFNFSNWEYEDWKNRDLSVMDILDHHIWMAGGEFYKKIGYNYEAFDNVGYENVVKNGEKTYRENPAYWKNILKGRIQIAAAESKGLGLPLCSTECWGLVDYKDWPLLSWDWIKELCEFGVLEAASTGRWTMMATSNFCGPQFVGMWRDIAWHQRLTNIIHNAKVDQDLLSN